MDLGAPVKDTVRGLDLLFYCTLLFVAVSKSPRTKDRGPTLRRRNGIRPSVTNKKPVVIKFSEKDLPVFHLALKDSLRRCRVDLALLLVRLGLTSLEFLEVWTGSPEHVELRLVVCFFVLVKNGRFTWEGLEEVSWFFYIYTSVLLYRLVFTGSKG